MENPTINPFEEREEFAKRFLLSCRKMLEKHLILKGTETMRGDMVWLYMGDGIVHYEWTETVHHPAGYHEMGSLGAVTFASFSEWDEEVRSGQDWDVLNDCPPGSPRDRSWTEDMIKFMDLVFSDHPVSWDWVMSSLMPAFNAIAKYW